MGTITYKRDLPKEGSFRHGRGGLPIRTIMLHSSCGRVAGDIPTLTGHDPNHNVSCHWYIDRAGNVRHLVDNHDTAYHAGEVINPEYSNAQSIGIEMEHFDPDDEHPHGEDWPEAQVRACAALVAGLWQAFPGVVHIVHHSDAAPRRKVDPVNFNSAAFWEYYQSFGATSWTFEEAR